MMTCERVNPVRRGFLGMYVDKEGEMKATKRERVTYESWGPFANKIHLPAYAMRAPDEKRITAVCRAIERTTGLMVLTCRPDGTHLKGGKPEAEQYEIDLGRPARQRGVRCYDVSGRLWVKVPTAGR